MPVVAAVAAIIAAVVAATGSIMSARAQSQAAKFQAKVAEQQAERERLAAETEADTFRRRHSRLLGTSRARRAGSNITGEGSPLLVDEQSAAEIELGFRTILSGGTARATRLEQEARLARFKGKAALTAGAFEAGSSLLGGLSKAFGAQTTAAGG